MVLEYLFPVPCFFWAYFSLLLTGTPKSEPPVHGIPNYPKKSTPRNSNQHSEQPRYNHFTISITKIVQIVLKVYIAQRVREGANTRAIIVPYPLLTVHFCQLPHRQPFHVIFRARDNNRSTFPPTSRIFTPPDLGTVRKTDPVTKISLIQII